MSWDSLTQTLNVVGSTRKDVGVDDDDEVRNAKSLINTLHWGIKLSKSLRKVKVTKIKIDFKRSFVRKLQWCQPSRGKDYLSQLDCENQKRDFKNLIYKYRDLKSESYWKTLEVDVHFQIHIKMKI